MIDWPTFNETVFPYMEGIDAERLDAWKGLFEDLRIKWEPIVRICPAPVQQQVLGFELLGTDRNGTGFGAIVSRFEATGVPGDLLRIAFLVIGLDEVDRFSRDARKDLTVDALVYTLNLDHELLASPLLRPAIGRFFRPGHRECVVFEFNERCLGPDALVVLDLIADYGLRVALDDSDKLAPLLRTRLAGTSSFAKLDAFTAMPLLRNRAGDPVAVLREIARHRLDGKPYVVEGLEEESFVTFLRRGWQDGDLWGQGWSIALAPPFTRYLTKFVPGGYILV